MAIAAETKHPNIIYIIGDGMGPAYTTAYRYFADNPATKTVESTIFDQLLTGMASTYPDDDTYVTDSAAAATALATGTKSYNGAIAMDHEKQHLTTLFEHAKAAHFNTGVVVTSQINHATPASFLSHNESRRNYDDIADSYIHNTVKGRQIADLMFGGGQQYFIRPNRNLVQEFNNLDYQYQSDINDLHKFTRLPALGLFAAKGLPPALGSEHPTRLNQMTHKALQLLTQEKTPFVLLIEASQIDWCGHSNDISCAMAEMDDLAATVTQVKQYIDKHPNTLMVMTADHSTGGLTLGSQNKYLWQGPILKQVKLMPAALAEMMQKQPDHAYQIWHNNTGIKLTDIAQASLTKLSAEPDPELLTHFIKTKIDQATLTGWTTKGHTAIDVQVFAYGVEADKFSGHMTNSDIAQRLFKLVQ
nr:alkaline phosphatase [Shewanella marina]